MDDIKRAAIIGFLQSIFPVLALAGVHSFTADEVSVIMLLINNGLTLFFLLYKKGQEKGPTG